VHKLTYAKLKSAFPVFSRPGNKHKGTGLTFEEFHYAFANNMSETDAKKAYDRYAIQIPVELFLRVFLMILQIMLLQISNTKIAKGAPFVISR